VFVEVDGEVVPATGFCFSSTESHTMKNDKTFQCGKCKGTFLCDDRSEQEKIAETEIVFGEESVPKDRVSVCSTCWEKILLWMKNKEKNSRITRKKQ